MFKARRIEILESVLLMGLILFFAVYLVVGLIRSNEYTKEEAIELRQPDQHLLN